jgi:exonuclease SbcC
MVVVDHYQSSRPRSAANLSGGETFLVSLALALGLSKLASQNVQIDSLFLDEGFGSLDEETLEEALHTLSNLRQEGKLVGLISHVTALTQQIPVRIEVIKGSLGRSRLSGPGINMIAERRKPSGSSAV